MCIILIHKMTEMRGQDFDEMWHCPNCKQTNHSDKFNPVCGTSGLLCPVCCTRYAVSRETIGKMYCARCTTWYPRKMFTWVHEDKRDGAGWPVCPGCKEKTPEVPENMTQTSRR